MREECVYTGAPGIRKVRVTRRVLFLMDRLERTSIQKGKGRREGGLDLGERGSYGWRVAPRRQRVGETPASRGRK